MTKRLHYKSQVLDFIRNNQGVTTDELRKRLPRAPIRELEKVDKAIVFRDEKWYTTDFAGDPPVTGEP